MSVMTGLSGNEMYCLHLKGLSPGELVVGNSVYSLGFVGGIGAGLKSAFGGEVTQITQTMPLKLVLGTAVYSLGFFGGLKAMFKSFSRGEVSDLTSLVYDAREHAIRLIKREADAIGADDVVGVKTHIHELGGLIEFMAIGTAVKRVAGIATATPTLPTQAIIKDKDTWISRSDNLFATIGASTGGSGIVTAN